MTDKITIDIGWHVGLDPRSKGSFGQLMIDQNIFASDRRIGKALRALQEQGVVFDLSFRKFDPADVFISSEDRFYVISLTASEAGICVYRLLGGPILTKEELELFVR